MGGKYLTLTELSRAWQQGKDIIYLSSLLNKPIRTFNDYTRRLGFEKIASRCDYFWTKNIGNMRFIMTEDTGKFWIKDLGFALEVSTPKFFLKIIKE